MSSGNATRDAVRAGLSVYRTLLRVARQAPTRGTASVIRHTSRVWFQGAQESWNHATLGGTSAPSEKHLAAAARRRMNGLATARWLHEGFANRGTSRRLARACFDVRRHRGMMRAREFAARQEFLARTGKEPEERDKGVSPGQAAWVRGMNTVWQRYGVVTQHPLAVAALRHADREAAVEGGGEADGGEDSRQGAVSSER